VPVAVVVAFIRPDRGDPHRCTPIFATTRSTSAEVRQVTPGDHQRVLQRILGPVDIPKDPTSDREQAVDARADQVHEGDPVATLSEDHEVSIHRRHFAGRPSGASVHIYRYIVPGEWGNFASSPIRPAIVGSSLNPGGRDAESVGRLEPDAVRARRRATREILSVEAERRDEVPDVPHACRERIGVGRSVGQDHNRPVADVHDREKQALIRR
jgi:hypothetical protein